MIWSHVINRSCLLYTSKKGRKVNAVSSLDKSTNIINNNYEVKAYMLIKKKTVNCVFDNTKLVIREVKIKKFKDKKYRVSSGFIKIKAKVCTKCGKVFLNSLDQPVSYTHLYRINEAIVK